MVGKNTTSKFDLNLRDEAGEVEKARFDMNEEVTVVGHQDVAKKEVSVKLKPGKKAPKATQVPKSAPAPKTGKKPKADAGDKDKIKETKSKRTQLVISLTKRAN